MLNVIVPVDFSDTSINAAKFAANMYEFRADVNLILYHYYSNASDSAQAATSMGTVKAAIADRVNNLDVVIETGADFIDALSRFTMVKKAYLIIMGLTGKTALAQRFSGTNTLKMAEKDICPILIIPPDVQFRKINNVLIASEMKAVEETPTLLAVKRVLSDFKPAVHVLNVDTTHYISLTPEFKEERDKMAELLKDFNPEFYFMRLYDFQESMNLFIKDKNIDMVIIAPQQKGFFDRIFKTQHTKSMIYQSTVPVLTIQE